MFSIIGQLLSISGHQSKATLAKQGHANDSQMHEMCKNLLPFHIIPTFMCGQCTMTYASMQHGRTLPPTIDHSLRYHPFLCTAILSYSFLSSFSITFPSYSFLHNAPLNSSHAHATSTSFPGHSLRCRPLSLSSYYFISYLLQLRNSSNAS